MMCSPASHASSVAALLEQDERTITVEHGSQPPPPPLDPLRPRSISEPLIGDIQPLDHQDNDGTRDPAAAAALAPSAMAQYSLLLQRDLILLPPDLSAQIEEDMESELRLALEAAARDQSIAGQRGGQRTASDPPRPKPWRVQVVEGRGRDPAMSIRYYNEGKPNSDDMLAREHDATLTSGQPMRTRASQAIKHASGAVAGVASLGAAAWATGYAVTGGHNGLVWWHSKGRNSTLPL